MGQRRDLRASRKDRELPERRAWEGRQQKNAASQEELSHQYTRALPMPAVRPLFLILHKEDVDVDGGTLRCSLSEGFVMIRVDADLNGVMLV